jgi:hypothetical protein
MDTDELLRRVRAIPGVMEASVMPGRQCDRLYVKVASGDANPVNRQACSPVARQIPGPGVVMRVRAGRAMRRLRRPGPGHIELDIQITYWSERPRLTKQESPPPSSQHQ